MEATSNGKMQAKGKDRNALDRRSDIMYKSGQPSGYSQDSTGLPMVDGSVYSGSVAEGIE